MTDPIPPFIARWAASGAAERANYQLFLTELCDALELPRPDPATADEAANAYVFDKAVPLPHGTIGFMDLYRRGCFVLEAKQGSDPRQGSQLSEKVGFPPLSAEAERRLRARKRGTAVRGTAAWDTAMERAKEQAQGYARNLPPDEVRGGRPPFLVIVDVGQSIALYTEFSRTGGNYIPFPDPRRYRIGLAELADPAVRELLRQVWLDPMGLDPARRTARVTREIAGRLARLAQSLEGAGHGAEAVAGFLMRCLFTMFAEDVGLLPRGAFSQLLADARRNVASFPPLVAELWRTMATGGFSVALRVPVPHFNGGLFEDGAALPLNADQLQLLIEAAGADWRDVEPAIFGTLLMRALDPVERHNLGAHFTPRAYVERLVLPTIIEPLRAEWDAAKAAALLLAEGGRTAEALAEVEAFQRRLASVRILDPAAGSGNFLYVTLEHLKRLEGEALEVRRALGGEQMLLELQGLMVRPEQFHGLEVNPWAAAIAELVLWIGFLQWHLRTRGDATGLPEPILRNLHNIECRDAVLAWDAVEPLLDAAGRPITRWDGRTLKPHPVTGEPVPDETARVPAHRYINPRPATWPEADFIVGNPPFIGTARMREALGDGYAEAVRRAYRNVPDSADYVMFWWDKAAELVAAGRARRFGLITTNSLRQTFNRRVLEHHLAATPSVGAPLAGAQGQVRDGQVRDGQVRDGQVRDLPLHLAFAIPDHPWVDSAEGAAVRIAMTVAAAGAGSGVLQQVVSERPGDDGTADVTLAERRGEILADLTIGANIAGAQPLQANAGICGRGVQLFGSGFIVTPDEAQSLGLGTVPGLENHIRPYRNGRDLTAIPRDVMVIDLFGLTAEEVRSRFPAVYQWVYERVKPERDQNNRASYRNNWWIHGEPRAALRPALAGLPRYIATVETSRRRFFIFLDAAILPDNKLINIALDDAYFLGVLSSRIHLTWALAAGSWLGVGNDPVYVKTACFEKFPFPAATEAQQARIRGLAEELDSHRKRQQALHPKLTLTDMYNVLGKLRAGEPLTAKEKATHEQGLVSVLRQLHDELDAAVATAYGWPPALPDDDILARLVALNAERAAEEAAGHIRWLRPTYQAPTNDELRMANDESRIIATDHAARITDHAPRTTDHATIREDAPVYETTPAANLLPWPARMAEQAQAVRAALAARPGPATAAQVAAAFAAAPVERVSELLETLVTLGQARGVGAGWYAAG